MLLRDVFESCSSAAEAAASFGDVPNRFAVRPEPGRLDYRIPKFNLRPASIQANFFLVHVARLYDSRNMADQRWNSISGIVHVLTQTQWLRI